MENRQTFGQRLREALGYSSYRELADFLSEKGISIDYKTLRRYLVDERRPDYPTLIQLAEVAEVSIDWLLTGSIWKPVEDRNKVDPEFWDNGVWRKFSLDELDALQRLAYANKVDVEEIIYLLSNEGLRLRDLLMNPAPLPYYSLANYTEEELCVAYLMGEIGDDDKVTSKEGEVSVPIELLEKVHQGNIPFPLGKFHAYRVTTHSLSRQGIQYGDLLLCSVLPFLDRGLSLLEGAQPFLVPQDAYTRLLPRRLYGDGVTFKGFIFRPLKDLTPIERLKVKSEELVHIAGIVTP